MTPLDWIPVSINVMDVLGKLTGPDPTQPLPRAVIGFLGRLSRRSLLLVVAVSAMFSSDLRRTVAYLFHIA